MADLKVKISEFPLATEAKDSDDIAILQDGVNKRIKTPKIEEKILEKVEERYVNKNKLGVNNGVATLGSDGLLSLNQRPPYNVQANFVPINLLSPPSEVDGVFVPTESGTYENYGNIEIDLNEGTYIITKIGNEYEKSLLYVQNPKSVDNISELRLREGDFEGQIITLLGYYEAGDKQPLNYKYTTSQGVDDGGYVINTNSGSWEAILTNYVDVLDFGAKCDNVSDDTIFWKKAIDLSSQKNIEIVFTGNTIVSNLPIKNNLKIKGFGKTISNLIFKNYDTTGVYSAMFQRADDDTNVAYFSIRDCSIVTSLTGVSAAQDANPKAIGLNLCGVPHCTVSNIYLAGLGYGALIFSRAESGAEGLGFVNTVKDGNYNYIENINMASCGKFNQEQAAIWLKYRANSNKFYNIISRGGCFNNIVISRGTDNAFFGGSSESNNCVAVFGEYAYSNYIFGYRGEGMSNSLIKVYERPSETLYFANNTVIGVHGSGYPLAIERVGEAYLNVISTGSSLDFYQPVDYSTNFSQRRINSFASFLGFISDNIRPIMIRAQDIDGIPSIQLTNDRISVASGDILSEIQFYNNDNSANAKGVNSKVQVIALDNLGKQGFRFQTGRHDNLKNILDLNDNVTIPSGLWNTPHLVIGDIHIFKSTLGLRYKIGNPTSDTDGILFNQVASTTVKGLVNQAEASADTATQASGATPTKAEFDDLLAELRDVKTKLRTAGILAP